MKKFSPLFLMVISILNAVVWTLASIKHTLNGEPNGTQIFCAIVWTISSVLWILHWIKSRKPPKNDEWTE